MEDDDEAVSPKGFDISKLGVESDDQVAKALKSIRHFDDANPSLKAMLDALDTS